MRSGVKDSDIAYTFDRSQDGLISCSLAIEQSYLWMETTGTVALFGRVATLSFER